MKKWIACLLVFIPLSSQAQEWTADQQEVWTRLTNCFTGGFSWDIETRTECYHRDYMGWAATQPTPMPPSEEIVKYYSDMAKTKMIKSYAHLKPLHIKIHGEIAIIHYMAMILTTQPEKDDETSWIGWTDIMLKENGKWYWIADHGRNIETDD